MTKVGAYKKFDKTLHAENDESCKKAVSKLLEGTPYSVKENVKKMGVDMHVYKGDVHIGNLEVERKLVWDGSKFPYPSVNFPYRKRKFTDGEKKTVFVMFNKDFSAYLAVSEKNLIASPVNMVRNKYVRYGEQFYQVATKDVSMNGLLNELHKMEKNK